MLDILIKNPVNTTGFLYSPGMPKLFATTPQSGFIYEIPPIKWSRFIGLIFVVHNKEEVKSRLDEVRSRYIDATHHCYAYHIGWLIKSSDDGEPSGTAGKPILSALQRSWFDNVILIIVRYFGGTMLGAPGLMRAYGDCAKQTLQHVPIIQQESIQTLSVAISYDTLPKVMQLCKQYEAQVSQQSSDLLTQKLSITINTGYADSLRQQIVSLDPGNAIL
jgi:uncharacterized YigZ family protein